MWLMAITTEQERSKIERLYLNYSNLMYSEAYKILNDRHLAEDAVQQSFLKLINNLHKIEEEDRPRTRSFLVIICVNVAKSIYTKKLRLNNQSDDIDDLDSKLEDSENDPLNILIDKDSVERIVAAIETLDPIYRDVLLMKRTYKFSREEIADAMDISLETVKKRLLRARKLLAKVLEKEGLL